MIGVINLLMIFESLGGKDLEDSLLMMKITKILHNLVTDYDNKTYDTGRSIALVYFTVAIFFEGYHLFKSPATFDVQEFLVGGAAFLAGLGAYAIGAGAGRPKTETTTRESSTD